METQRAGTCCALAFGNELLMALRAMRDSITVAVAYIVGVSVLATASYFTLFLSPVLSGAIATFLLVVLGPLGSVVV